MVEAAARAPMRRMTPNDGSLPSRDSHANKSHQSVPTVMKPPHDVQLSYYAKAILSEISVHSITKTQLQIATNNTLYWERQYYEQCQQTIREKDYNHELRSRLQESGIQWAIMEENFKLLKQESLDILDEAHQREAGYNSACSTPPEDSTPKPSISPNK